MENTLDYTAKNYLLETACKYEFTEKLDQKILPHCKYVVYFANETNETQFCCFMNLWFKSLEDGVYTFDGSITYEDNYRLNGFSMELVWDQKPNTYYLNDLIHKKNQVDVIKDREDDGLPIWGSDIIRHFFKNPPTFLPKSTLL